VTSLWNVFTSANTPGRMYLPSSTHRKEIHDGEQADRSHGGSTDRRGSGSRGTNAVPTGLRESVTSEAPEDGDAYRQFVLEVAQSVAEAAKARAPRRARRSRRFAAPSLNGCREAAFHLAAVPAASVRRRRGAECGCQHRRRNQPRKNPNVPETAPQPIVVEEMQRLSIQKPRLCGAFAEPSDGLEPSTPSLPWRCSTN
jgi:hypothetical protein